MRHGWPVALLGLSLLASLLPGCAGAAGPSVDSYLSARLARAVEPPLAGPAGRSAPAAEPQETWLPDMDKPLSQEAATQPATTEPEEAGQPVPWRNRRGPAYKGDWLHSFGRDAKEMPATLWDDTKATFTDPWALVGLGVAGASGIALCASNADHCVAHHFRQNGSQLNTFWDSVGDVGGNPATHFAFTGAMYFASLAGENTKAYETSKAMLNALAINGLTTVALKGLVHTRSPNGDIHGWPSGHTSSSFCFATVMHEAYGPWVGVPLFAFASYVGYERLDARNHDFSDVISGAFLGMAIGHAVMQNHKARVFGFELMPWADPKGGAMGLALVKDF